MKNLTKMVSFYDLKPGMIVRSYYKSKSDGRPVVVLNVTWKDLVKGINTDHAGLHGFRGLWYWNNKKHPITRKENYGKIKYLGSSRYWKYEILCENIRNKTDKQLVKLIRDIGEI